MSLFVWIAIAVAWVACGVYSGGKLFAAKQENWPSIAKDNYDEDRRFLVIAIIFGPVGLFATWTVYGLGHRWRLK